MGSPAVAVRVGLTAFWGGLIVAGRLYPGGYDWQYTTISSLVYAERNPAGYLWARAGMLLCAALGCYWSARCARHKQPAALHGIGIRTLALGYLCLGCCALLPETALHLPKAHDSLALAAFLSLCTGTVLVSFTLLHPSRPQRRPSGMPKLWAAILAGLAFAPVLLAAAAQGYVSRELPWLPWVSPLWRARAVPAYLSFAFWEWVTCAVVSLYLVALSRASSSARR